MRRYRKLFLIVPALLGIVAAVVVPRFFRASDQRPHVVQRSGEAITCPNLEPRDLPSGMAKVETITRNLGGGVFGKSTVFSDGYHEASFHIGYDIIFALDDLDFVDSNTRIGTRRVTLHVPRAFPQGTMYAASWDIPVKPAKCALVTVVTKQFSRAEFDRLVEQLRIAPKSPGAS